MLVAYPSALSLEGAAYLIKTAKDRKVMEELPDVAYAVWNVQGFVQRSLIGPPTRFADEALAYLQENPSKEFLADFGEALATIQAVFVEQSAEDAYRAIPVWVILVMQTLPMLISALKELGIIKDQE